MDERIEELIEGSHIHIEHLQEPVLEIEHRFKSFEDRSRMGIYAASRHIGLDYLKE